MTLTLYPYELSPGLWVFDDREVGLKEEAFVFGISEMITSLIEKNYSNLAIKEMLKNKVKTT